MISVRLISNTQTPSGVAAEIDTGLVRYLGNAIRVSSSGSRMNLVLSCGCRIFKPEAIFKHKGHNHGAKGKGRQRELVSERVC
jgi:hypothetical protein